MRIVHEEGELEKSIQSATTEAKNAFGDPRVYVEKYLEEPHHIEFQILADQHGNVIHLNERECSVQRRYQKIIEESPSPFMTSELREEMGKAVVEVAKACDYVGAGTVECLVDKYRNFYFLEMNTRLQVEHPVTEQVTGIDLVKAQIDVANGKELPWMQDEIIAQGHAIECRVYAEDAHQNFAPSIGTITDMHVPDGFGVRFDGGIYAGLPITTHYDPMIGKLVCWGNSREEAIRRSLRALEEFAITGVKTSLGFCANVLRFEKFANGKYDTHILEDHMEEILSQSKDEIQFDVPASVASTLFAHEQGNSNNGNLRREESKRSGWKITGRERGMQG